MVETTQSRQLHHRKSSLLLSHLKHLQTTTTKPTSPPLTISNPESSSSPNPVKHLRPTSRYQTLPIRHSSRTHLRHPCRTYAQSYLGSLCNHLVSFVGPIPNSLSLFLDLNAHFKNLNLPTRHRDLQVNRNRNLILHRRKWIEKTALRECAHATYCWN